MAAQARRKPKPKKKQVRVNRTPAEESALKKTKEMVGSRIREARNEKDMSQGDLAKLLGISRASIAQWETGVTSPAINTIEIVAKLLNKRPEALAFGVTSEPKIVYREPEDSGYYKIPEIRFGDSPDDREVIGSWGAPIDWIKGDIRADPKDLIVFSVVTDDLGPQIERGDKVIVDTSNDRPSPPGNFLHWDGLGATINKMSAVPSGKKTTVRVSGGQDSYEIDSSKVSIIGRIVGVWKKS